MEPPAVPPTPGPPELDLVLKQFWEQAMQDIASSKPDRKYSLPLSRIKKIMRFDEDVNMVSQEVLRMFDKCCLLFIQELTLRAWNSTLEAERKTVKRVDIAHAISCTDDYDFLIDIVPREEWQIRTTVAKQPPHNPISSNAQLQQFLLGRTATPQLVAQYNAAILQAQLSGLQHSLVPQMPGHNSPRLQPQQPAQQMQISGHNPQQHLQTQPPQIQQMPQLHPPPAPQQHQHIQQQLQHLQQLQQHQQIRRQQQQPQQQQSQQPQQQQLQQPQQPNPRLTPETMAFHPQVQPSLQDLQMHMAYQQYLMQQQLQHQHLQNPQGQFLHLPLTEHTRENFKGNDGGQANEQL